jgi:hypothetical protein
MMVEAVVARESTPFAWGGHDCCLFAADVVRACTGVDYAEALRGYTNQQEAQLIIDGYGSMTAMITALLERDPIAPAMARRLDVVLAKLPAGETLGICMGSTCAFARTVGVAYLPRSVVSVAWRIV